MTYMQEANAIADQLRGKAPAKRTRGPAKQLSTKHMEVLDYMRAFFADNDQLPPLASIAKHFGVCNSGASWYVDMLKRHGMLEHNAVGKLRFARGRNG